MPLPAHLRVRRGCDGDQQPEAPSSPKPEASSPRNRAAVPPRSSLKFQSNDSDRHSKASFKVSFESDDSDRQPEAPRSPKPEASSPRARAAVPTKSSFKLSFSSDDSHSSQPKQPFTHTSQIDFASKDQTVIVFDFDDTLFPTSFVDLMSKDFENGCLKSEDLDDFLHKIEECEDSAESLLQSALKLGHVVIVTLCSRGLLKKRCETWFSRVWEIMLKDAQVVYARESKAHQDESSRLDEEDQTLEYWAWVKGTVIEQELDRFYSQYEGQTWKNVLSIGDSNIERYATLGASNAYVQKRFSGMKKAHQTLQQRTAYSSMWRNFDSKNREWRGTLEGVHDGHIFKVRIKVVKMLDSPTPAQLTQQQILLSHQVSSIVSFDGSLNLLIDDLRNVKMIQELESAPFKSGDLRMPNHGYASESMDADGTPLAIMARDKSGSMAFTKFVRNGTKDTLSSAATRTSNSAERRSLFKTSKDSL